MSERCHNAGIDEPEATREGTWTLRRTTCESDERFAPLSGTDKRQGTRGCYRLAGCVPDIPIFTELRRRYGRYLVDILLAGDRQAEKSMHGRPDIRVAPILGIDKGSIRAMVRSLCRASRDLHARRVSLSSETQGCTPSSFLELLTALPSCSNPDRHHLRASKSIVCQPHTANVSSDLA